MFKSGSGILRDIHILYISIIYIIFPWVLSSLKNPEFWEKKCPDPKHSFVPALYIPSAMVLLIDGSSKVLALEKKEKF